MRMDVPIWFWAVLGVMVGLLDLTNHTLHFTIYTLRDVQ
jgi:hypothetical protein